MGACRVWFLLAWKERLLDIVIKVEKRRKVLDLFTIPSRCLYAQILASRLSKT